VGFFDKIKSAVGQLTGSNGKVTMQLSSQQVKRGDTINVTLQVNATGDLQAKGVHVELVGTEYVKYLYPESVADTGASATPGTTAGTDTTRTVEGSQYNQTFRQQTPFSMAPLNMQEGQSQQFTGTIQVPANAQPTYLGVDARHTWKVRAFVDVSMGADPDTEIEILVI
jgi:hypothetical protein